jgi:protein KRI1
MPTRFKYTTVQPQSYALAPAEILVATDAELNQYLSVKKYAPYRKDSRWDATRSSRLKELKQQISERGGETNADAAAPSRPTKKRKGKSERLKMKAALAQSKEGAAASGTDAAFGKEEVGEREVEKRGDLGEGDGEGAHNGETEGASKRRRRRKRKVADE